MVDSTVNAGVGAQTGFALQRNTALYLLLENYVNKFKQVRLFYLTPIKERRTISIYFIFLLIKQ